MITHHAYILLSRELPQFLGLFNYLNFTNFLTDFGQILEVCKYACMQVCKYASMLVCRYASMQVCKYVRECKYASMHMYASMQVYTAMLLYVRSCGIFIIPLCNVFKLLELFEKHPEFQWQYFRPWGSGVFKTPSKFFMR